MGKRASPACKWRVCLTLPDLDLTASQIQPRKKLQLNCKAPPSHNIYQTALTVTTIGRSVPVFFRRCPRFYDIAAARMQSICGKNTYKDDSGGR